MADEAVRKEFEAWAKQQGCELRHSPKAPADHPEEIYWMPVVQSAWEAWQAARSAAIQECADILRSHQKRNWEYSLKIGKVVEHKNCLDKLADFLLALKER